MTRIPVDASAFSVFDMQALSAETFDAGLASAGDELAVVFFWGFECFNCEIAKKAMLAEDPKERVELLTRAAEAFETAGDDGQAIESYKMAFAVGHSRDVLEHLERLFGEVLRREARTFEVSERADEEFLAHMLERMEDTVFVQGSCATARSYYYTNEGDAVLLRPTSSANARRAGEAFPVEDYDYA